ncbi:unnamed protein product [Effrenium voratum]|nr:unnamed protein product [Effrenium voratum]
MRPMRIFAAAFLLAEVAQGVRPDRELDDGFMMFDQAELKRVSDALKNGDMASAVASNLERQRRSSEVVTGNMATSQAALQIAQDVPEDSAKAELENTAREPAEPAVQNAHPQNTATLMEENSNLGDAAEDGAATGHIFFKDVAKSHEQLDQALQGYKDVADKEEQRAAEAYQKLGAYKNSITNLRSPLQQISSQVKQLHSKMVKVLEADEKERLEPLNSLEAKLEPESHELA